jgi:dipeptidyl aminopeptidase/acylaminoacyl peptidase
MSVMTFPSAALYPARKGERPLTAQDLWAVPRVGSPSPSPDGTLLAVTVTTYDLEKNQGKGRIWLVPAGGGAATDSNSAGPRPLTSPDSSSSDPVFSPDGKRLAFTRKVDGGKAQLHVMPLGGGEAQKLTDLPLGVFDPVWLPDGSGIVFGTMLVKGHLTPEATRAEIERRDKDPVKAHVTEDRLYRYWDTWLTTGEVPHLFVLDLASGGLRDLMPESIAWFDWMDPSSQYDLSPDGKEVAYAGVVVDEARSLVRTVLFTVPVAGGTPSALTMDHPADDLRPRYSPDGRSIVYGMQHDPFFYADRVRLMRYDRAGRTHAPWLDGWDLSPMHWEFAADGTLVFEAEENGRISGFVLGPRDSAPRRVVQGGSIAGLTPATGGRLYFTLQSISQPAELHAATVTGGAPERLTRFTDDALAKVEFGEVRELQVEGGGGESVQMFVVLPPGFHPGTKYPLVQVVHGGPHAISADSFHFRWNAQAFAAPGYVVAMVNFQGSTSWGQDFAKRIQGAWGDRPFEDVMRATDVLVAAGMVDETRMAAVGGSYGGYMMSWIEGHTDRFKCIVNHAGVYDLLSQYASDVTQGRSQAMGGEPWEGIEVIDRWNPARFANGFQTPMLVIHGEKDYRVPVSQGLECYGVLKAKGVPARLVYFPDENHWVLKPANSILWYREVLAWIKRWLGA